MDTYAEPGPSGISSYDYDNDTDMVSEVCTFNSHFNLLALQAAQPCYSRRELFPSNNLCMIFIASILLLYYGRDWLDIKFVSRESRVMMLYL